MLGWLVACPPAPRPIAVPIGVSIAQYPSEGFRQGKGATCERERGRWTVRGRICLDGLWVGDWLASWLAGPLRVCISACLLGWSAIYVPSPPGQFGANSCVCRVFSPRFPTERKGDSSWRADFLANGMPRRVPQPAFDATLACFSALSTLSVVIEHKRQGEQSEDKHTRVHTKRTNERERDKERCIRVVGLLGLPIGDLVG